MLSCFVVAIFIVRYYGFAVILCQWLRSTDITPRSVNLNKTKRLGFIIYMYIFNVIQGLVITLWFVVLSVSEGENVKLSRLYIYNIYLNKKIYKFIGVLCRMLQYYYMNNYRLRYTGSYIFLITAIYITTFVNHQSLIYYYTDGIGMFYSN